ncbi:hypothetical protein IQ235_10550 [Oscillatoriales cyanobacterium LEGE 11467]|uniref:Uncharacterized protein n=1 Tax=Zarconia navalis LEGE 11467 TaxID=1828826 RepID=A0A928VZS2_9CYAN|nr:hypothetical protein [Zarconia navalis]MBE9041218.1 hypothetical protein [Zarconia navalis LEGE 11467]
MNTQHITDGAGIRTESSGRSSIVLVVLASFVLGFVPIVWSSTLMSANSDAPTVPGEGTLWSELGQ